MSEDYQGEAAVFKAFCNEYRLKVLERLRSGEKCACDLQEYIGISQSNLSHHMKVLCASGVVESWQEGKWTHYRISEQGRALALRLLDELTATSQGGTGCSSRCAGD